MAKRPDGKSRILQEIARAYEDDYQKSFKKNFAYTYRLTDRKVEPAADELRNAFDHFAAATIAAMQLSGITNRTKKKQSFEEGLRDVIRGRRHIAAGDFHCVRFSTLARIKIVAQTIEDLENLDKVDMGGERRRLYELSREAKRIPDPTPDRYEEIERVITATNDSYDLIKRLRRVANDLDMLFQTIILDAAQQNAIRLKQLAYIKELPFASTLK